MSKSFRRSSYQRASDVTDDTHRAATEHALAEQIALATSWAVHIRAAAQLCDLTREQSTRVELFMEIGSSRKWPFRRSLRADVVMFRECQRERVWLEMR